jgi:hypothetical protein
MLFRRPLREVIAALGDQPERRVRTKAVCLGQVRADEGAQRRPHLEPWLVALARGVPCFRKWIDGGGASLVQLGQYALDLRIAFVDLGLAEVVQLERLAQREQVLGPGSYP